MKHLHAILTTNCNLRCPHCGVPDNVEIYNEEKVLEEIKNFDGEVTLFGGECTLYEDRFIKALETKNVRSVSTNMMDISGKRLELFRGKGFATSWNPARFTPEQYQIWLRNLKAVSDIDAEFIIMITLTPDLIMIPPKEMVDRIQSWEYLSGLESIRFEQLIDPSQSQEFYNDVDDWLCEFHIQYKESGCRIRNMIDDQVMQWIYNCHDQYTLYPDGRIVNLCAIDAFPTVCTSCIGCKYAQICTPCRLQKHCTFPKKLYEMIKKEKGE